MCTGEYFYSPLHKRWGTFVVLEQPPSCSDLTCHPGHHTDQIATLSNIVFYFSCLLLSVVTSKTKAAKNICWALEATSVNPLQLQRKTTDICNICLLYHKLGRQICVLTLIYKKLKTLYKVYSMSPIDAHLYCVIILLKKMRLQF